MIPSELLVEFAKDMLNVIFEKGKVIASKIIDYPEVFNSLKKIFPVNWKHQKPK